MEDRSVLADIKGPAERNGPGFIDHPVSFGGFLTGVTENRIIELKRLCETTIGIGVVAACGKVGDFEFTKFFAALTERLAFACSTTRKRLGIPGNDDGLLP